MARRRALHRAGAAAWSRLLSGPEAEPGPVDGPCGQKAHSQERRRSGEAESRDRRRSGLDLEPRRGALPRCDSDRRSLPCPAASLGVVSEAVRHPGAPQKTMGREAAADAGSRGKSSKSCKPGVGFRLPARNWLIFSTRKRSTSIPQGGTTGCAIRSSERRVCSSAPVWSRLAARPSSLPGSSGRACSGPFAEPMPSSPCGAAASANGSGITGNPGPAPPDPHFYVAHPPRTLSEWQP